MLVFFGYFFQEEKEETVDWQENYQTANKGPFGTFLTLKLLEAYFPENGVEFLKDSIAATLQNEENPANYLFIGSKMYMDSLSESALLEFVEKGNKAFIVSKLPPIELMSKIFADSCAVFSWKSYEAVLDSNAYFNLQHPNLKFDSLLHIVYEEQFDTTIYNWHHLPTNIFCEANYHLVELGSLNEGLVNFVKIDFGDGSFYFHTNPVLYSNWILKKENGFEYVHRSFAHLEEGEIYWDKRSRHLAASGGGNASGNGGSGGNSSSNFEPDKKTFDSEGPLQYILAQRSLAWAWYLSLILGLLYLLFRAKRRQRIIPVLEANRNTSLEFIATIGRMYFVENNHRKLAIKKMKLFLAYVREHYKLPTKNLDKSFVEQLSSKAEVSPDLIKKIVETHGILTVSNIFTEQMLIAFHQDLDQFYKNDARSHGVKFR